MTTMPITSGRAPTLMPRAVKTAGADRPRATELLTPADEADLVAQLAHWRDALLQLIEPFLPGLPGFAQTKLDHFDEKWIFFDRHAKPNRSVKAKISRRLRKFKAVKQRLALANIAWVAKLAHNQTGILPEEDLFQEGFCGLLKAIDRFEPSRGLRLMTYATWYIREAMQQMRARQSYMVSLSTHDQTLLGQLEARRAEFQHAHDRLPNLMELRAGLSTPPRSLARLQSATSPTMSLESRDGQSHPVPVPDSTVSVDHREEVDSTLSKLLEALPQRERMIVTRRFGLDGHEPLSLETLGGDLKVSMERVRQLQRQAIRRMQNHAQLLGIDWSL